MRAKKKVKVLHTVWLGEDDSLMPGKHYTAYKQTSLWMVVSKKGRAVTVDDSSIETIDEDWIYLSIFMVMGLMLIAETLYLLSQVL